MPLSNRTTGELITAAYWNDLVDAANAQATASTITTTGTTNALALPAGLGDLVIFANNATLLTIYGIAAGTDGQHLTIYSIGAGQVDVANQAGSATAANRIINGVTGPLGLSAGSGRVALRYDARTDATTARWRVLAHEQGAWITPTFNAADFSALTGSWTVGAGDVNAFAYRLSGRSLTVAFSLATTTVAAGVTTLVIVIPSGYVVAKQIANPIIIADNGGAFVMGYAQVHPPTSTTQILLSLLSGTLTASTNLTSVYGSLTFEIT